MIVISSIIDNNALDAIAKEWLKQLKDYMLTKRIGRSRFLASVGGNQIPCSTRFKKSCYMITSNAEFNKLLLNRRKKIIALLKDFCRQPELYVLANNYQLEDIAKQLDGKNKWMVKFLKGEFKNLYEEFTGMVAYDFLKRLQIRTCPYCNRNYTFTIKKVSKEDFSTRAELDHFYDKSSYPLLALSFYNLVPSCHTCNHSKLVAKAGVNPYFEGFTSKFKVIKPVTKVTVQNAVDELNVNEILGAKSKEDFSLAISTRNNEEQKNIEVFGLHELYNEHKDYVMDIIDKANAYNSVGAQNLIDAFQGTGRSPQDVLDFVWGRDVEDKDFINQPLSKLKHDILEQLGIK